uniref:Uncharacterized protein n=1 Tax=Rhizobium rhizogenes TaxID=359 RepID=A0A7S4ZRC1_RHIRH|nr:hypothetical protein pC5.7b_361 [Rhizobium rhizogenes]QCL09860.1 hypothetical protein pC5.8b_370 [Rhizobium rhizogenes]
MENLPGDPARLHDDAAFIKRFAVRSERMGNSTSKRNVAARSDGCTIPYERPVFSIVTREQGCQPLWLH